MYGHDTLSRPSRRTFVKGLAMSGAAASLGWLCEPAWALTPAPAEQAVLTGTSFDLRIGASQSTSPAAHARRSLARRSSYDEQGRGPQRANHIGTGVGPEGGGSGGG